MAHNFRNEVRKLNLITSLRPNGSASGRMAHLLQDFQFDAGNPFFIQKSSQIPLVSAVWLFHLLNSKLPEESQVKLHEILWIMNQNNLSPINYHLFYTAKINLIPSEIFFIDNIGKIDTCSSNLILSTTVI